MVTSPGVCRCDHRLHRLGATPSAATHHPERFANVRAYKVLEHQHVPEVLRFLATLGETPSLQLVPTSAPVDLGIFATCFVPVREDTDPVAIVRDTYAGRPLVRLRSVVVFAICVSIYTTGFSPAGLAILLAEIVGYILLVLFGLSRLGAYVLKRVENEEDAYFVLMLSIMAIAGVLASAIQLPGIVGAFLAGLAINASAQKAPASLKLDFLSKSFFIPIFFVVTGFMIDPVKFIYGDIRRLLPRCQHCWSPAGRQVDGRVGCR